MIITMIVLCLKKILRMADKTITKRNNNYNSLLISIEVLVLIFSKIIKMEIRTSIKIICIKIMLIIIIFWH